MSTVLRSTACEIRSQVNWMGTPSGNRLRARYHLPSETWDCPSHITKKTSNHHVFHRTLLANELSLMPVVVLFPRLHTPSALGRAEHDHPMQIPTLCMDVGASYKVHLQQDSEKKKKNVSHAMSRVTPLSQTNVIPKQVQNVFVTELPPKRFMFVIDCCRPSLGRCLSRKPSLSLSKSLSRSVSLFLFRSVSLYASLFLSFFSYVAYSSQKISSLSRNTSANKEHELNLMSSLDGRSLTQ